MASRLHANNIIRFLTEAVSFVLEYNNMNWEPTLIVPEIISSTVPLFTRSIGEALTHYCMQDFYSLYQPDWLHFSEPEAEIPIGYYLREYVDTIENEEPYGSLFYIALICQLCVHAIRLENPEIIRPILTEAATILHFRCYSRAHFRNLVRNAVEYSSFHRTVHQASEDDGFCSVSDE
ncbi:uncharacterized protein TNIN_267441 [Trichonephila inaurata madagascariensis]|uniref:Uncharacterized protein n=1 Tax=Trichonephila inaurata madagascariensis TaxID=2747483 RepID=A0A8X6Y8M1_9ARAC|nr:uncharacterized protein TNIN_267441 [Trichonephila inaurata madagascariensis]